MGKDAKEIAAELLTAALQSGKFPISGVGKQIGENIGEAFTAIHSAVKQATSSPKP